VSYKKETITSRERRQKRVRRKVRGRADRPRLCIYRSLNHIYVQAIDDTAGVVLASASSLEPSFEKPQIPEAKPEVSAEEKAKDKKAGGKKNKAKPVVVKGFKVLCSELVGKKIAERVKEKGINQVVFDRNGFLYHGRVKAVAEAARKAGLQF
jgi:large subunit ribosomal protein L18